MKYKSFEQNKIFMILNCIIFLIACLILKNSLFLMTQAFGNDSFYCCNTHIKCCHISS